MNINRTNYDDFLIQKLEGLLSTEQNAEVDLFLHNNSDIRAEWEAFEQTKLVPDETIVYEHKSLLKKSAGGAVIPMYRTMMYVASIAASLLLMFFVGQKYFFNSNSETPIVLASNNPVENNTVENSSPIVQPQTNPIVADNFPAKSQPTFSKQTPTVSSQHTSNIQLPISNFAVDLQPMNPLSPTALKSAPRISYASFIWTRGLRVPSQPQRQMSQAGAWIQVASVLGSELLRISGRGQRVNQAPLELQIKPVEVNIHNAYFNIHKIISFKKKNSNNK